MKNNDLAKRVKELRNRKGLSQEILAEKSGLSLRTVQRIENGETEPRGDTLKRLSTSLNVTTDEIIDWAIVEDKSFLAGLNLSALAFLLFPVLGILLPLIMWISRKDKLKNINQVGKEVINFQLTWTILIFITYAYFIGSSYYQVQNATFIQPSLLGNPLILYLTVGGLYLYNLILVFVNTFKIKNDEKANYLFKINFIK